MSRLSVQLDSSRAWAAHGMAEGNGQDLLFKEGPLLKRQRGLNHKNLKNLKFQDRVCRLTSACLEYYEKRKLKGRFELEKIRIVAEAGPFGRHHYCFQVGDEVEVMYFAAKSAIEREDWMKQFRQAAIGNDNKMLSHYHGGAYGLLIDNRWSCCGNGQRMSSGCVPAKDLQCHRSSSMSAVAHGGHTHKHRKPMHMNTISEGHRTLPRRRHPSSPSTPSETAVSLGNSESPEDETISESCPPQATGFTAGSSSPYRSRRAIPRSASYDSIDTLLSEDSGRGVSTIGSSRRSSQVTMLSTSMENLLSTVPVQSHASSTGIKSRFSLQFEQGVSVDTERAKAKEQASGVSNPSGLNFPMIRMYEMSPLGSPSEDDEVEEEKEADDKADSHRPDMHPNPPLFTAFSSDNYKVMKSLLDKGADPNVVEPLESARSVLHHACAKGCVDIVELLLKHRANVNLRDGSGNLPLTEACKNGSVAIVEMLLTSGAQVDLEGANGRTPLHEAANAGHCDVIKVLMSNQADPMLRDSGNDMPYDLAFKNDDKEAMEILQQSLPLELRPYRFLGWKTLDSAREITTLAFRGLKDVLVSGSIDCRVNIWDAPSLAVTKEIPVPNTVLSVDTWTHYLAIGSTTVELFSMNDWEWKLTLTDHNQGTPRSENPPLHLLAFAPTGHLATASVESNTIKLWPPPHPGLSPGCKLTPEASIPLGTDQETGCICSLSVSPSSQLPWMAVGFQPGKQFCPVGNKILYLINWTSQKVCYTINTGRGGLTVSLSVTFSPDGRHLAVGCGSTLSIWETESGSELHKSDIPNGTSISSLCYSPSDIHLMVGLSTGEVQVNGVNSSICIFSLGNLKNPSATTTMAYSKDGNLLAVGHADGTLQLWKAHTGCVPSDVLGAGDRGSQASSAFKFPTLDEKAPCIEPELARRGRVTFDSYGGRFCSLVDDFSLVVPEGAIQEGICSIEHGVIPHGPCGFFEFPDGWSSVSPIVWFCSTPGVEFSKPLSVTLPHYLRIENEEEGPTLAFLKASHNDCTVKNNEKVFQFRPVEEITVTSPHSRYGTIDTTHFCYYCLAAHRRADTSEARFCLVTAKPVFTESRHWRVFFCLTYFLNTCLQLVDEQAAEEFQEGYELSYREVTFAEEGPDAGLEIKFDWEAPGGWIITRESPQKVYANEVDFWDMPSCNELKLRCERKLYPPRFTLKVSGNRAIRNSMVRVEFLGTCEDLSTEIPLILPETNTVPVPMLEAPINIHESIGLKAAPKVFQKLFGTLCRSIEDPLTLAVDLLSEGIVDDEAVQKTLTPNVPKFEKAVALLLVVKKAIETQPNHFETVCRILESESNGAVQRLRAEFDRNRVQLRSRHQGSYSGSSGDGGSADASMEAAPMTSLSHPVQSLLTDGHSGYTASEGTYLNGHRSSWSSSTISPQYPSDHSSPQAEHFHFRYSVPEHSFSQATPGVPTQEHGDFSASEEPNRGLVYSRIS